MNRGWKKGQSGNPAGRPKRGTALSDLLREYLKRPAKAGKTHATLVVEKLVALAEEGNPYAIREIMDRIEGKAPMPIEHSGTDGGPIHHAAFITIDAMTLTEALRALTDAGAINTTAPVVSPDSSRTNR